VAAHRFEAELETANRGGMLVEVPLDIPALFGAKRPPVRATVNGHTFRSTIAVYGGRYFLGLNREVREAAGVALGDRIVVELERDDEPRVVEIPAPLAAALQEDAQARSEFEGLSFTHRREYAEWIAEAKRDETRARRVARAVEMLRAGAKHP
jgi:Bacteriocin-protection, YdeI or OmpD-Associated/Domain of unknown function (DUF1905)